MLGSTLTTIVITYRGIETSFGAISRLKMFEEKTEPEGCSYGTGAHAFVPGEAWRTHGHVQISRVEASYDGASSVLKGLTLKVEIFEEVAVCGRTGRYARPDLNRIELVCPC